MLTPGKCGPAEAKGKRHHRGQQNGQQKEFNRVDVARGHRYHSGHNRVHVERQWSS